jgi:SAM-dependent methyltransferase
MSTSGLGPNSTYFTKLAYGLILDCGCGTGQYRERLERQGKVIAMDIERKSLKASGYENIVLASATRLPFKNGCFDTVWASATIEHVREDCLPEIIRVGKQGIVIVPNPNSPIDFFHRLYGKETWFSRKWHPDHVRPYRIDELRKFGRVYGCDIGILPRNLWAHIIPQTFWILFPRLSHTITLFFRKDKNH